MNNVVCHLEVFFSGHVQGVGFRYQTRELAKGFEVTGCVENLPDGRVRLEVEGEEAQAQAFLREVSGQLQPFIKEMKVRSDMRPREFANFVITG